ncbi:MAG: YkgJ family cysteine cluster protein [Desulfarculaceae bacterium]|nr:YkgJ family cysteine cluster protein [Desulfarculaceae bacterium]MCF8071260.1 YkgJ family cysteine cluster protein [Desulfarculaceae bacterium]MCF8101137.1 YkgJ family cysteine cluster protein [Desulfarculaceae bacterium]MCF8115314.1 YkgJ family cysteine cluster protein [Desulfarculaceae bacterium]
MSPEQAQPPLDLAAFRKALEQLWSQADQAFAQVAQAFAKEVRCGSGCDDCCHAVFDLTPAEVLGLALAFRALPRAERREALRRAEKAAAEFDQIAKAALSQPEQERLTTFSRARIACPLLVKGRCLLYAVRPLTCRIYGVPVAAAGGGHACPRSGFDQGESYPTVDWDLVQQALNQISAVAVQLAPALPRERIDLARALTWASDQALTLAALEA